MNHREPNKRKPKFQPRGPVHRRPFAHPDAKRYPTRPKPIAAVKPPTAAATSWEHVAGWYDKLVGDQGSDYQRNLVMPAAMELLAPAPGQRVLDLCCGQGVFSRLVASQVGVEVVGVDASPALIAAAKSRGEQPNLRYVLADARKLGELADGRFDSAACVLAIHDIDSLPAVLTNLSTALKPGGCAVFVMMHPCFRIPRQSSWGWDEKLKIQYRRLDRYSSPMTIPIATHPGSDPSEHTFFFHRSLAEYLTAMGRAGLAVVECRELVSHHRSEPGPRSRAENRSRSEFPIFLALKAVKLSQPK